MKNDKNMNKSMQLLADEIPSALIRCDEPMSLHTSFRIGGPADVFLSPRSYEELRLCLGVVRRHALPCFLLGGGTNVLVADRGIRGVVIYTGHLAAVTVSGATVSAQAGAEVAEVCKAAAEHNLAGVEFLHGLPGTIGGAVWMNARCYGGSLSDVLVKAEIIDENLEIQSIACDGSQFGYKRSPFQAMPGCIWEVTLQLTAGDSEEIYRLMYSNHADRVEKGHFRAPSAGSLFKNNRDFGAPTGRIIDELGLRGTETGGAAIAPFHGNIFINQKNATAMDVLSLIRLAMETAARERNIRLEPEVRIIGDWRPEELAFLDAAV